MGAIDYDNLLTTYIVDEDKLVTYKWLSKELEMHVNAAKNILKDYWEKHNDADKLVATFLVIGQLKDGTLNIRIVKDSNLDKERKLFSKIDCEHIYSLQKSIDDLELLAIAGDGDLKYSMIKVKDLPPKKIKAKVQEKVLVKETIPKPEERAKKIEAPPKDEHKSKMVENKVDKKPEVKRDEKIESSEDKKSSASEKSKAVAKGPQKNNKKPVQSKQAGFSNLFGKVPSKPINKEQPVASVSKPAEPKSNETDKNIKVTEILLSDNSEEEEKKDFQSSKNRKESKKKTENKSSQSKKRNKKSDNKGPSTKRRRIKMVSDSSDSELEKSDDEVHLPLDEPMEVEPEPEPQKNKKSIEDSPPKVKTENGKRMIRKSKDEKYKDTDGFIVTRRVYVYEEAPAEDEEVHVVKEIPTTKEVKPKEVKKKQTTLSNFFKRS